eukprot:2503794-Rhodomonas_salina.1
MHSSIQNGTDLGRGGAESERREYPIAYGDSIWLYTTPYGYRLWPDMGAGEAEGERGQELC